MGAIFEGLGALFEGGAGDLLGGLFGGAGEGLAGAGEAGLAAGAGEAGALGFDAAAGGGDIFSGLFGAGEGLGGGGAAAAVPAGVSDLGLGGVSGVGASSFSPAAGVDLGTSFGGGIAPDATSAAAFNPIDTFAGRAAGATDAIGSGAFDPVGSEFGAPGGASPPASAPEALSGAGGAGGAPGATGGTAGLDQQVLNATAGAGTPTNITPAAGGVAGGAGGVAPGAAAGAAAPKGLMDTISGAVAKNPLGIGLGAAGLGYSIYNGQNQSDAVKKLADAAAQQSATGSQLSRYALTGTLPPGSQAAVDQAISQAKANAVSNAAGQGLPTDPTRNTALAATLAKIDQQGPIIAAQIAQSLLSSGASFSGLSNQLYSTLAGIDQTQTANMGKAIANFSAALSNRSPATTIQIGGTSNA